MFLKNHFFFKQKNSLNNILKNKLNHKVYLNDFLVIPGHGMSGIQYLFPYASSSVGF